MSTHYEDTWNQPDPAESGLVETGYSFITPCCTSATIEFQNAAGEFFLATRVAGHGWAKPIPGMIGYINETGIIALPDGQEIYIRYSEQREKV